MTWPQAIIVYFVCWWLFLFMALPFGVKPQQAPGPGMEPGAPEKTWLGVKAGVVSVLAGLATWAIDFVIHSGIVAVK
jgi:predicted secreted protein